MRKQFLSLLFALACVPVLQAQHYINWTGIVKDASGTALVARPVSIRFTLQPDTSGSAAIYQEIHNLSTTDAGFVHAEIGKGNPPLGSYTTVHWGTPLKLKTEINSGNGFVTVSDSRMKAVPYAKYAEISGSLQDKDIHVFARADQSLVFDMPGSSSNILFRSIP